MELNRREFLLDAAAVAIGSTVPKRLAAQLTDAVEHSPLAYIHRCSIYVSTTGSDTNTGSIGDPLRSFAAAQAAVRASKAKNGGSIIVYFRSGTYYLPETVKFSSQDSGEPETPVIYAAFPGESVVISGGRSLQLKWTPYRVGIMMAKVPPGTRTDQLFVNGERQILARYPNFDPNADRLNGWAADAISKDRVSRWRNPRGGYVHGLNEELWGSVHYRITGKNTEGDVILEGGWQQNYANSLSDKYRFVENIFEELDAPKEWFLDETSSTLYYYPPGGLDLQQAEIEIVQLKHLVDFQGNAEQPVKAIQLRGFVNRTVPYID
ncbi:MAG: hypothetical protein ACLQMO_02455 [Acidobacteriaceae bacterium]